MVGLDPDCFSRLGSRGYPVRSRRSETNIAVDKGAAFSRACASVTDPPSRRRPITHTRRATTATSITINPATSSSTATIRHIFPYQSRGSSRRRSSLKTTWCRGLIYVEHLIGYGRFYDLTASARRLARSASPGSGLCRPRPDRPPPRSSGFTQALAAVRDGDAPWCPSSTSSRARSRTRARSPDELEQRGARLQLGRPFIDSRDPMGKMFFNALAAFAELDATLPHVAHPREGMLVTEATGTAQGQAPKLDLPREQRCDRQRLLFVAVPNGGNRCS